MAAGDLKMEGVNQAIERLKQLPKKLRGKAGRRALGKAAAVIKKAAKANALRSDDPGTGRRIADNIAQRVRSRYGRQTGDMMVSVGVLTSKGRIPSGNPDTGPKGDTFHWHLVELGASQAKAQPFLRPALTEKGQEAIDAYAAEMEKQVDLALQQLGVK